MRAWALCAAVLWAALAMARAAPKSAASTERKLPATPRGFTQVVYVTRDRFYLDRGERDGLAAGLKLVFTRDGRAAGSCVVELVSPGSATCTGGSHRPGELARLPRPSIKPAPEKAARLPPIPSTEQLEQQRVQVLAASGPYVKTESREAFGGRAHRWAQPVLTHESWATARRADSTWHQERVDLSLRGAPIAKDTRFYLEATALQWTGRPNEYLSPHTSATQLFIREAALVRREDENSVVLSAGRVWPYRAASLGIFDGAQLGYRSRGGELEAGAFAGAIPRALNTAPQLERPLIGAYQAYTFSSPGFVRWLQQEAHLAYLPTAGGDFFELEALARAWFAGGADLGLDVRGTSSVRQRARLEAARFDLGLTPAAGVRLNAAARYDATPLEVLLPFGAGTDSARTLHAIAAGYWDPARWLTVGLSSTFARDLEYARSRLLAGPELVLPHLAGDHLALSAGYQEEWGWLQGRDAWLQLSARPTASVQLLVRGAYYATGPSLDAGAWERSEWAAFGSARWAVSRRIFLRASVQGRFGVVTEEGLSILGLTASASAGGAF